MPFIKHISASFNNFLRLFQKYFYNFRISLDVCIHHRFMCSKIFYRFDNINGFRFFHARAFFKIFSFWNIFCFFDQGHRNRCFIRHCQNDVFKRLILVLRFFFIDLGQWKRFIRDKIFYISIYCLLIKSFTHKVSIICGKLWQLA